MAAGFRENGDVLCASYQNKTGHQRRPGIWNPLELFIGQDGYENRRKLFDHIVGLKAFEKHLVAGAIDMDTFSLDLHVSYDGGKFVKARIPPDLRFLVRMKVC